MPEIEHHDLVLFADQKVNLKKDEVDDQRAQVNRLRDRIEAKIAVTPGYGLVKSLHAGSVAKGTALSSVNDRDLAVYVRAEQAPNDVPSLVYWLRDRVVEAYSTLSADQIVANSNCVTVTFAGSGLSVDVVPVLYQGEPNDVGHLVNKDTGEKLLTSVRQHLDFIRGRKKQHPVHLAQLIRFTKWWVRQQRKRDAEFRPASALPARGNSPIQVLDPANFDNNVAKHYTPSDRDRLVTAAAEALDTISTAYYEPAKGQAAELWQDVLGTGFQAAAA